MKYLYFLIFIPFLFIGCEENALVSIEESHWEYENPNWADHGYIQCGGNSQSPVDIITSNTVKSPELSDLQYRYNGIDMVMVDNGHTIQIYSPSTVKNEMIYNGNFYDFKQMHFHRKSEHTIDGKNEELEIHIVHQDNNENLLVLTLFAVEGEYNEIIGSIFSNIPKTKNEPVNTGILLDPSELMPEDQSYYTYFGSLTTPPCSASVQFVIMKEPIQISREQIDFFNSLYRDNRRPVQPLNNRLILEKIN